MSDTSFVVSTPPASAAAPLIDIDVGLEWAQAAAARWGTGDLLAGLAADSDPAVVRAAVEGTIARTAGVMARAAAAARTRVPCSSDEAEVGRWLAACVDAVAEPDARSDAGRAVVGFGTGGASAAAAGLRPLRRWTGALRENTQAAGVRWVRGHPDGGCRFTVVRLGGVWTVIEHGWSRDEEELRDRMVPAAAAALVRQARAAGKRPAPEELLTDQLAADADSYCVSPDAQSPLWSLHAGGGSGRP